MRMIGAVKGRDMIEHQKTNEIQKVAARDFRRSILSLAFLNDFNQQLGMTLELLQITGFQGRTPFVKTLQTFLPEIATLVEVGDDQHVANVVLWFGSNSGG